MIGFVSRPKRMGILEIRAAMVRTAVLFFLAAVQPAAADSSQELRIGGLTFANAAGLVLESQEVWISLDSIAIKYRLSNNAPSAVSVQLNFPLPDIDVGEQDTQFSIPADPPANLVTPRTLADGAPVVWTIHQRAYQESRDITDLLRKGSIPLLAVGEVANQLQDAVAALPTENRRKMVSDNTIQEAGTDQSGAPLFAPNWIVKTWMVAPLRIASGATITLEHSYKPSVGRAQDTVLRKALRNNKNLEPIVRDRIRAFCVENDLLRGIDKIARDDAANVAGLQEWRISFGLKTATGLNGPAKDFHLVIDKARPDRLVSFCMTNVHRMKDSQTSFETRRFNFRPDEDVNILLIGRADGTYRDISTTTR